MNFGGTSAQEGYIYIYIYIYTCIIWAYYIKGSQQRCRTVLPDCYRWCPMESILSHYTVWWRSISYYGRATTNPHLFIVIQCYSSCSYHSFIFIYQLFSMYLSFISYKTYIYIYIQLYHHWSNDIQCIFQPFKTAAVLDSSSSSLVLPNADFTSGETSACLGTFSDFTQIKNRWSSCNGCGSLKYHKKKICVYIYHMYHICDITC